MSEGLGLEGRGRELARGAPGPALPPRLAVSADTALDGDSDLQYPHPLVTPINNFLAFHSFLDIQILINPGTVIDKSQDMDLLDQLPFHYTVKPIIQQQRNGPYHINIVFTIIDAHSKNNDLVSISGNLTKFKL